MYRDYRVVCFVPAGRKELLEVLTKYFEMNRHIVDEVMLWENTMVKEDIEYMRTLEKNDKLFKCYRIPEGERFIQRPVQYNTGRFYKYTIDPKTIYIRFDDDMVFIDRDYFKNILDFRIDNPDYFLVFGNIFNNAVTSYLYQKNNLVTQMFGICSDYCMDSVGWGSAPFAVYLHKEFWNAYDNSDVKKYFCFERHELENNHRFSISNFAFFGKDFAMFRGDLREVKCPNNMESQDEELWLTYYPSTIGRKNVICGNALTVHFTFSPHQSSTIKSNPEFLGKYKEICRKEYELAYYNMLGDVTTDRADKTVNTTKIKASGEGKTIVKEDKKDYNSMKNVELASVIRKLGGEITDNKAKGTKKADLINIIQGLKK
jgi:hypothetical protein